MLSIRIFVEGHHILDGQHDSVKQETNDADNEHCNDDLGVGIIGAILELLPNK